MESMRAEKEISRPPAPRPLPSPPEKESGDTDARTKATKMARQIGDEEWKQGNTKYALEAWEASDISMVELLEKAQLLLRVEVLMTKLDNFSASTPHTCKVRGGSHGKFLSGADTCEVHKIKEAYFSEAKAILAWSINPSTLKSGSKPEFYRAAAVACLKLIKRMR